jgi:RHS repeat-associated protein
MELGAWLGAFQALGINKVETRLTACAVPAYAEAMQVEQPRATFNHANVLGGDTSGTTPVTTHYYWYDGNGNVTGLMRSNGTVDATHRYTAFGGNGATTTTAGTFGQRNPYRFSTKYLDNEVETVEGTYYYGYRHYAVALGRWPSRDPIGESGGRYLYVLLGNQCIARRDRLGLKDADDPCACPCKDKDVQAKMKGESTGGTVVCCGGKKFSCSNVGDNLRKRDTPPAGPDSQGGKEVNDVAKLIDECAKKHEDDHYDAVDCPPDGGPTVPPFRDQTKGGIATEEGLAHSAEIQCLEGKKGKCNDSTDPQYCKDRIDERKKALSDNAKNEGWPIIEPTLPSEPTSFR